MTRLHPDKQTYFTCLLPPEPVRAAFNRVAAKAPGEAFVKNSEDLHVTLNLLQIPRKRGRQDLIERLGRIEFPAFDIKLREFDTFYRIPMKGQDSHVVWLRPDGLSAFKVRDLHARILLSLRSVGYTVGSVIMTPHMTALKYPFHADSAPLEDFMKSAQPLRIPSWNCDRFYLARTRLRSDALHPANNGGKGSKYEVLEEFALR